jgi:hypothetical protein
MKCPNCGTNLTCGCQKRVTKEGKTMCTKCIHAPNKQTAEPKK